MLEDKAGVILLVVNKSCEMTKINDALEHLSILSDFPTPPLASQSQVDWFSLKIMFMAKLVCHESSYAMACHWKIRAVNVALYRYTHSA